MSEKTLKFNDFVVNTAFSDNEIPKEKNHYICIEAVCIDSIMKIVKKRLSSNLSGTM